MSTDFGIIPPISASELFDGRIKKFGVREHDETLIDDDNNHLAVGVGDDGNVISFVGNARAGNPSRIIDAVETAFPGHRVYSEHEPQYYGDFETMEEVDAAFREREGKPPLEIADMVDNILEHYIIFNWEAPSCECIAELIAEKWPKRLSELGVSSDELAGLVKARVA